MIFSLLNLDKICPSFLFAKFFSMAFGSCFFQWGSSVAFLWGVRGGCHTPPPPKENFEAKVLNFAVLSFGSRILSFSFKFLF